VNSIDNPLLTPPELPYGAPAFTTIKLEHYKPALLSAISTGKAQVDAIVNDPGEPGFCNTVEALEFSGEEVKRIAQIFSNLNEACTSGQMQELARELSHLFTEYQLYITLNEGLFNKIKTVYERRDSLDLNPSQLRLLTETYKSFSRNGANLSAEDKKKYGAVQEQLAVASLKFSQNLLAATNAYLLLITDPARLDGLPEFVREMAASEANEQNKHGWVFTLDYPSYSAFLKYSTCRELKEEIWKAYNSRCLEEFDNRQIMKEIARLRIESAQLLGYDKYSEYALEPRMAKTPQTVNDFLNNLMNRSLPYAKKEIAAVRHFAETKGFTEVLMPWDFFYWSEKYREEKFSLNEESLKPYFRLESVVEAVLGLATRLYGLRFNPVTNVPVYHPDVRVYEVTEQDGRFMALLYTDYFPRESKRGGAWMTTYRDQSVSEGKEIRPLVSLVTNFTKPTENTPSLLTFSEVTTLLHEFGHCLHGILAEGAYASLTGTNVARDFVELPSQIMENWAYEPEFLQSFARHYLTSEPLPQEWIDRIVAARIYLAGYNQVRQLQFGLLDMAWHDITQVPGQDPVEYEQAVLATSAVLPQIPKTGFAPGFSHIFAGGYSAGYYSYKWAEVLEADAFSLFREQGIFSKEVASRFRDCILSRGGMEEADVLYRRFRGRDPEPDALFKKLFLE